MTELEAILEQAKALSPLEREELLRLLSIEALGAGDENEVGVGLRGLAAWTESTRDEEWSMFYPNELRNGGRALTGRAARMHNQ